MTTESYNRIKQLTEHFRDQEIAYLSPGYQESQVRQDFIDKFFAALGWDVTHEIQKNPYEQEVKIENKVNTSGSQRRADYAFFTAPNFRDVKFFVEAKKPSRSLSNTNDYYQTIRYGWNSKTPIAVLTDFEEFHILDCRFKPDIKTALNRKIEVFNYTDFEDEEKFKRIFYLFSRDEVANGSIDKFAAALPKPRAKAARKGMFKAEYKPVDEAFLESLDGYREQLARAFKNKNQNLEGEELTEAVQRTIDRLVFIRFLEDKSIEEPAIAAIKDKPAVWEAFASLCKRLEPKYNGLVFKPHRIIDSSDFNPPDGKMFAEICSELADPTSPYDFDKIPISILGSIYERFLGKVVSTTEKRAKVIEKPEVRKAGGVYYTPEYIVRYIVNETVGKLLYEHASTPQDGVTLCLSKGVEDLKIDGTEHASTSSRLENSGTPLSMTEERSTSHPEQILSERSESKDESKGVLRKIKLTPKQVEDLKIIDIACGSGSFLIEVYSQLLDYHTKYYNEHPEKAKKGDTETREGKIVLSLKKRQEILTNNIYGVDIDFQATEVTQLSLYLKLLEDVTMNDAFQYSLLKEKILPDLRNNIVCGNSLIGTDILEGKLFDSEEERKLNPMNFEDTFPKVMQRGGFDAVVGNPPYEITLGKESKSNYKELKNINDYFKKKYSKISGEINLYKVFTEKAINILGKGGYFGYIMPTSLLNDLSNLELRKFIFNRFSEVEINQFPEKAKVFKNVTQDVCIYLCNDNKTTECVLLRTGILEPSKLLSVPIVFDKTLIKDLNYKVPMFRTLDEVKIISKLLTYPKLENFKNILSIAEGEIHLTKFKNALRTSVKNKNTFRLIRGDIVQRYELLTKTDKMSYVDNIEVKRISNSPKLSFLNTPRLIYQQVVNIQKKRRLNFYLLKENAYVGNTCGFIISNGSIDLKFLLGILNSKLMNWRFKLTSSNNHILTNELYQLNLNQYNRNHPQGAAAYNKFISLVEQMLVAKEKLNKAKLDAEINKLEMQIASIDRQIDQAVYELYGLTEEEIKIVEG
ncbi:MAG: Eco57I restriction-modification methylase domain-containing protein [Bacteroidota bacterium]|nr:Eco57I restriction-modification methylase domain-containing protein [Bacteroidota bacterium]